MNEDVQPKDPEAEDASEPSSARLILTLSLAGLISGLILVGVYEVTLPRILANQARDLREAVFKVLPGVESVALTSRPPLLSTETDGRFQIEGAEVAPGSEFCCTGGGVTADYDLFHTLGISLVRGRFFDANDVPDGPPVVVVDETLADTYWPGDDPIGKRIRFLMTDGPWHTVVGIASRVKYAGLDQDYPLYFHEYHQSVRWTQGFGARRNTVVVRTERDPLSLASGVRQVARSLDPRLPIVWMRTMDNITAASLARPRSMTTLIGVFACVALLLGALGVYGLISHSVALRTDEISIRIALGAGARAVIRLIVNQGMRPALAGVTIGLVVAIAGTRLMRTLLFRVSPTDPWTFAAVSVLLVAVGLAACYLPARRASHIDPRSALRLE